MMSRGKQKCFSRMAVAGAGAAGISAALCAAKRGLTVDLFESSSSLGGVPVRGYLHALAGFFTPAGELVDSPICRELHTRLSKRAQKRRMGRLWVLQVDPMLYRSTLEDWLAEFPAVQVHYSKSIIGLDVRDGLIVDAETTDGKVESGDRAFVDATGDASLAAIAGESIAPSRESYAVNFRVRIRGKIPDTAERAALKIELEKHFAGGSVWADIGTEPDELIFKMNFSTVPSVSTLTDEMTSALPMFPSLGVIRSVISGEVVRRGGPRLRARAPADHLTEENSFPVSWPYESWDGAEVHVEWPVRLPFRLSENYLRSARIENLFAVGKCAGLPEREHSAARVTAGCWAMGEQVAAIAARDGV